jgi:hypothetical protein
MGDSVMQPRGQVNVLKTAGWMSQHRRRRYTCQLEIILVPGVLNMSASQNYSLIRIHIHSSLGNKVNLPSKTCN